MRRAKIIDFVSLPLLMSCWIRSAPPMNSPPMNMQGRPPGTPDLGCHTPQETVCKAKDITGVISVGRWVVLET